MKVKNFNGNRSSDHYRDIGMPEWRNYKGCTNNPKCSALGCNEEGSEGSHVYKVDSLDSSWYICPFCHEHNESPDEIELKADWHSRLVPLTSL